MSRFAWTAVKAPFSICNDSGMYSANRSASTPPMVGAFERRDKGSSLYDGTLNKGAEPPRVPVMSFGQGPNERMNISGANLVILIDDFNKLHELYRLLRSYNPDLPMGPGMKAQFLELRNEIDRRGV